jgi:hypothetical protein
MPLDYEDTQLQIEALIQSKRRLDACMDTAEKLFGREIIEGEFFTAAYQLFDQQVKLIEAVSDLPVDVSWFVYENDCGRKGYEAGPEGEVIAVKTVQDLMDLAEIEKELEERNGHSD